MSLSDALTGMGLAILILTLLVCAFFAARPSACDEADDTADALLAANVEATAGMLTPGLAPVVPHLSEQTERQLRHEITEQLSASIQRHGIDGHVVRAEAN